MVQILLACLIISCLVQNLNGGVVQQNDTELEEISLKLTNLYRNENEIKLEISEMEWLRSVFDQFNWKSEILQNASHVCRKNMIAYLDELKLNTTWAAKMYDASGRYNGQYFFGNDFWLGSRMLCWELDNNHGQVSTGTNSIVPPFPVRFNVAKVHLTMLNTAARVLLIGFCLPSSCTLPEVKTILQVDVTNLLRFSNRNKTSLQIDHVRLVPGDYQLLNDVKFFIVGGTAGVVALVVIIATIFEIWLHSRTNQMHKVEDAIETSTNNNNEMKTNEIANNGISKHKKLKQETNENNISIGKGVPARFLLCFSALSNSRKILEVRHLPKDAISCVHGLRFLSVAWVILVHTYLEVFAIAENKTLRVVTERYFMYQTISNASFSVDTFFFISGLLVTILYFRTSKKTQKQPINIDRINGECVWDVMTASTRKFLLLVFYRLLRLTPAYLFVLGVHEIAIRWLHNNSVFEPNFYDHINCDNYWWRNALYINTWYPQSEICMLWSWYMSNDTQFYVMAVILLLIAVRSTAHLKAAGLIILTFLLTSWLTSFLVAYQFKYHVRIEDPFALFDQLYDKPWSRVGPYLVGMTSGWLLFVTECRIKIPKLMVVAGWLAAIGCLASLIYGVGKDGLKLPASAFYAALGHTAWGLALAWITIACCTGYGGFIHSLLSFRGFLPLSRLTYCAYLVHPMLMCITCYQMDGPIHLHNHMVLVLFFGNVVTAFLTSFVVSLGFEAPVVRFLKIIVGGRSKDD